MALSMLKAITDIVDEYDINTGILRNSYVGVYNRDEVNRFEIVGSVLYVLYYYGDVRLFEIPPASLTSSTVLQSALSLHTKTLSQKSTKSPTTSLATSFVNEESNPNWIVRIMSFSIMTRIVAVAVLVFLFVTLCALMYGLKRRISERRSSVSDDGKSTATTSNMYSSTQYTMETLTGSSYSTAVNTNLGIAVPAYMELKFNYSFRIGKLIAMGGCASLYVGDAFDDGLKTFGPQVVVKVCKIGDSMKLETFLQEISIMQLLEAHPNIVKILGYTMSPPSIVMKLYPLGDLQHFLLNRSILKNKPMLLGFIQDIANGLSLIHRRGLVHCDLKLQNVLLDTMGNRIVCVISDFGITNVVAGHSLLVSQFTVVNLLGLSMAYAAD
eukprot:Partr_v1_DN27031_c1_g1_i1_m28700 putative protein kinase kinase kinase